jgi:hypothetical protein
VGGQEEHGYDGAQGTWLDLSLGQLVDTPRDLMDLINQQQTAMNEVLALQSVSLSSPLTLSQCVTHKAALRHLETSRATLRPRKILTSQCSSIFTI